MRRDFPSHPDPEQPSAKPDEAPAPTGPTAFATPPAPPTVIPVGDSRPPALRRSGASWALEYRDAICACSTRTCVRDLQGAFIHRLEAVDYDDERDGRQYSQATRAAVRCYTALPEDT